MSESTLSINQNGPSEIFVSPNPSNGLVKVSFFLTQNDDINVDLYSLNGNLITRIQSDYSAFSGQNILTFNSSDISPGVYFIRLYGRVTCSKIHSIYVVK